MRGKRKMAYDFHGIYESIIGRGIIIFMILFVVVGELNDYRKTGKKAEKKEAIIFLIFAVYMGSDGVNEINALRDPKIECFEAKFERSYKDRTLKSFADYYFEGEETLCSDDKSMMKFDVRLEKGEKYRVYYEKRTKIIVKLEEL